MIWKAIPGFLDYEASENGDIRRSIYIKHKGKPGRRLNPGELLKQATLSHGYKRVTLKNNEGYLINIDVHVLVAMAFLGPKPFPKANALHWDDNKANNHYTNIRWGSHLQNRVDAIRNGTRDSRPGNAKLTSDEVRRVRKLAKSGFSNIFIAKEYSLHPGNVGKIVKYRYYKDVI